MSMWQNLERLWRYRQKDGPCPDQDCRSSLHPCNFSPNRFLQTADPDAAILLL